MWLSVGFCIQYSADSNVCLFDETTKIFGRKTEVFCGSSRFSPLKSFKVRFELTNFSPATYLRSFQVFTCLCKMMKAQILVEQKITKKRIYHR